MRCIRIAAVAPMTFAALIAVAPAAFAQGSRSFDIPSPSSRMVWDFDMWCSALQGHPAERCDARQEEDVTAYQAYVGRNARFATAREYKPWLGPMRMRKTNPGYNPEF